MIYLLHKEGVVYVEKYEFVSMIMLTNPQCINNKEVLVWTKNKTSWAHSVLFRPQSYRKIMGIDCCKCLWKRSIILSNLWAQKRHFRRMGKIPSVQLHELVDIMPSWIFEVIKANGGSTKYQIKTFPFIFCSLILYSCQNKILKLSMNATIHIKTELKFLHISDLIVFMPYLSYIWFPWFKYCKQYLFLHFWGWSYIVIQRYIYIYIHCRKVPLTYYLSNTSAIK